MDLFIMDGDGAYVWTAYGITFAALVLNYWSARRRFKLGLKRARQEMRPEAPARRPTVREI
jgi:heme exporter protein CcmD